MAIQDEVMRLVQEVPRPPDMSIPEGVRAEEIDALEKRISLPIPVELRQWLLRCNAPPIGPGGLFGIDPSDNFDIEAHMRGHPMWRERGWIPVAGDGVGDYYVLATLPRMLTGFPVLFIDHEVDYNSAVYAVSSGLWTFLRFLLREEMGIRYWPFDREKVLADDPALVNITDAPLPWETIPTNRARPLV